MDIFELRERDVVKVLPLFMSVFSEPPYHEKWTRATASKRLKEILKNGSGFCIYAMYAGKPVGLLLCQKQTWHDGVHVIIEDAVVEKRVRGSGIGSGMVEKLKSVARKKGISRIDLQALDGCPAFGFWRKHGFEKTGYVQMTRKV